MTHKVGDRVRVEYPLSPVHGQIVIVVACEASAWSEDVGDFIGYAIDRHKRNGRPFIYEDHELIPIYDGNEKTSWEDCVWQPKELVRVNSNG